MAGNIKGITIEFRGETSSLDKALRKVNQETRAIDRELKAVDKALKFNPSSVDLWRQKQELLKKKIDETKDKLSLLKREQAQMDAAGVDKSSLEYQKLSREIIETESKVKHFEGELRKVGNVNLQAAAGQIKEVGNKLTAAGEAMRGLSMAAAAVTAAIGALTVKSGQWADDLNTMSKVYGISTSQLQMYAAAAQLVDVDVDTIAKTHIKLEKSMAAAQDGTGAAAEAFEELGVSVTNSDGSFRSADEVWNDTIAALGQLDDETQRDALAMQLMGKSAAELNPLIEDGGETYQRLSETMEKYGLEFIDQETLDQANAFNDSLDTIKAIGLTTFQQLGTELAANLAPVMEKVVDLVGRIAEWLSNLSPETLTLIATIAGVIAVAAPLLLGLGKLATALNAIITIAPMVGTAFTVMTGPVGIAIAAIAALIAAGVAIYKNWDVIKAKLAEFKAKIIAEFGAIKAKVASIFNAIKTAMLTPFNTAVNLIRTAINKIKSIINGAKLQLPKFKLPHFVISGGKLPWGIGGQGKKPTISVKWYATGGIFDAPTIAGIGEKGPEAVVPLDILWDKLDKIAESSTGAPIVVQVYGSDNMSVNELAAAVEQRLIQMQKRRTLAWQ